MVRHDMGSKMIIVVWNLLSDFDDLERHTIETLGGSMLKQL